MEWLLCEYIYIRWKVGEWQRCSAMCGAGQQQRMITCERTLANGAYETVDTDMCDVQTRPVSVQDCHADMQCHQWQTGPWSRVCHTLQNIMFS